MRAPGRLLAAFALLAALTCRAAAGEEPLTLAQALDLALAASPGLAAARLRPEVARAGVAVARQPPDPELLVEEERETPHDAATLSQTIETAGKRRRRVELAEASVASAEAELSEAVAEVRNRVRRAFYTLAAAQRRLAEDEELLRLSERTRDTARQRFEAGDVPRLDVLQAELAAAQAGNEVEAAAGLLAAARSGLNTLLARPPATPLAVRGELADGDVPAPDAAVRQALAASAELAVLDRGLAEQQARLALARALRVPDAVVEGTVTHRSEPEFDWGWRTAVSVALPIFSSRGAAVRVEERTLAELAAEREARAAEIAGVVASAVATADAQRRQLLRFRDEILPQAAQVESMAEDSYRSGQTDLPALLQALQAARDVRLRALQAGADYQAALADLESAMGAPLP